MNRRQFLTSTSPALAATTTSGCKKNNQLVLRSCTWADYLDDQQSVEVAERRISQSRSALSKSESFCETALVRGLISTLRSPNLLQA
ncbi:MAG: hypothetical protein JHD23_04230 [Akkermansiaceae bacterium]|nr:hypothetical protein [Akkermansiaceae bacterium]